MKTYRLTEQPYQRTTIKGSDRSVSRSIDLKSSRGLATHLERSRRIPVSYLKSYSYDTIVLQPVGRAGTIFPYCSNPFFYTTIRAYSTQRRFAVPRVGGCDKNITSRQFKRISRDKATAEA